jgi:hypothetical protein
MKPHHVADLPFLDTYIYIFIRTMHARNPPRHRAHLHVASCAFPAINVSFLHMLPDMYSHQGLIILPTINFFSRYSLSCISTRIAIARYRVSILDQQIPGRSASIIETAVKLCRTCLCVIVQGRSIVNPCLSGSIIDLRRPLIAHIFEPVRSAVLTIQPSFAVSEATLSATPALRRIGAVEERNVLVADILEPTEYVSFAYA